MLSAYVALCRYALSTYIALGRYALERTDRGLKGVMVVLLPPLWRGNSTTISPINPRPVRYSAYLHKAKYALSTYLPKATYALTAYLPKAKYALSAYLPKVTYTLTAVPDHIMCMQYVSVRSST